MKSLFKIYFILFSKCTIASQVIIYYPSIHYKEQAIDVRNVFLNNYRIPMNLMQLVQTKECTSRDKRFLELCILENYELIRIENIRQEEIKESLLIFSKTTEVSYDY